MSVRRIPYGRNLDKIQTYLENLRRKTYKPLLLVTLSRDNIIVNHRKFNIFYNFRIVITCSCCHDFKYPKTFKKNEFFKI
jgi:hypothetical protein